MNGRTAPQDDSLPKGSDEKPELHAATPSHDTRPLHETVDAFDNLSDKRGW